MLKKLFIFIGFLICSATTIAHAETDCLANQFNPDQRPSLPSLKTADQFYDWRTFIHFSDASVAKIPLAKRAPIKGASALAGFDIDDRAWQYDFLSTQWSEGGCGTHKKTTQERSADDVYNFKFWQYIDMSYYFGHALLTMPPTMWTNAAHKNGVVSIGTFNLNDVDPYLYLNPEALPKTIQTLADIAKTLGFDGYLINYENYDNKLSAPLLSLMEALRNQGFTMMWYDAPLSGGFANYLNKEAVPYLQSAGYFQANYWWDYPDGLPAKSEETLKQSQLDNLKDHVFEMGDAYRSSYKNNPYDVCKSSEYNQFFTRFKEVYADDAHQDHYSALGFYAPNWTMFGGAPDPVGDRNVPGTAKFEQADAAYWEGSGAYGCGHADFQNVSYFVDPRTVINDVPFYSDFNTGVGIKYFVAGKLVSTGPWSDFSIQSVLPTWQNVQNDPARLTAKAYFDYQTAYAGGSSLKIEDEVASKNVANFKLYKTNFVSSGHDEINLIIKSASNETVKLVVNKSLLAPIKFINLDNGWQQLTFKLSTKTTVQELDVAITPDKDGKINVNLGSLKIADPTKVLIPENQTVIVKGGLLSWNSKHTGSSYRIYGVDPANGYTLLNEVANTTYDVHGNIFNGTVDGTKFGAYLIQEVTVAGDIVGLR